MRGMYYGIDSTDELTQNVVTTYNAFKAEKQRKVSRAESMGRLVIVDCFYDGSVRLLRLDRHHPKFGL